MHWIAPSEEDADNAALEKRLWDAANQFRANSGLEGEIKHGGKINSYYDDPHDATGRFDFVLAKPSRRSSWKKARRFTRKLEFQTSKT